MALDPSGGDPGDAPLDPGVSDPTAGGGASGEGAGEGKPAPSGTLAEGVAGGDDKPGAASWPDDWREKLAGKNEAFLKVLKRYASAESFGKGGFEAMQRIRSGEAPRKGLPENPSEEDVASYRKENGIPEKPDGYDIKTSNGYVFGDADKPILENFKTFAHGHNWTPAQVNQGAEWYAQLAEQNAARQQTEDATFREQATETLREEWGPEYRRNITTVQNFLASHAPDGMAARLLGGRMADGSLIGNDPDLMRFLVGAALDANPMARVVPAGSGDQRKSLDAELAAFEADMRGPDSQTKYWNNQRARARYQELLGAQAQMKSKG